jgi:hypothetical protein
MAKPKKAPTTPPLVVVPPPPEVEVPLAVPLAEQTARRSKKPLAPVEHPGARDSAGKASRTEIRRVAPRATAPRKTGKPAERSSQPRSSIPKPKGKAKG